MFHALVGVEGQQVDSPALGSSSELQGRSEVQS